MARAQHHRNAAGFQRVDHHQIGPPARRHQPPVVQPENARGGDAGHAIGRQRRGAQRDGGAYRMVEVAFLGDVERVPVVGAEGEEGRVPLRDDRRQRMQVLRHRAFAHQNLHALGELLQRLFGGGGLVVGADARTKIAVEVEPTQQRRMPVDAAPLKRRKLGHHAGIAAQHAGKIHHLRQPQHPGVTGERQQV
jgi:hypothetical protein